MTTAAKPLGRCSFVAWMTSTVARKSDETNSTPPQHLRRRPFIIDGIDELRYIDKIEDSSRPPFVNMMYHLMKPDFLFHHRCVFVGRPRVTRMLHSFCRSQYRYAPKKIEVCGFSQESVKASWGLKQPRQQRQRHSNGQPIIIEGVSATEL